MQKIIIRYFLLFILFFSSAFVFGETKVDSLQKALLIQKDDTNKVNTLNELSKLIVNNNYKDALVYSQEARKLAEKKAYQKGIISSFLNISSVKIKEGEYAEALKYANDALAISQKNNYKNYIGNCFYSIGVAYDAQGNYTEAIKNFFTSLKISEELDNKFWSAANHVSIGVIYMYQNNNTEALKSYKKALELHKENQDQVGIARCFLNIGIINAKMKNFPEALRNFKSALSMATKFDYKPIITKAHNNIGFMYKDQGKYAEALEEYFISLKIREEIKDKIGIVSSYTNIAEVYIFFKKYKEAQKYLDKSLTLASKIGAKERIKNTYELKAKLDSAQLNYKGAYDNYKLYISYRDSLINEENTKKTVRAQMNYEFDKKDATAKLEQEKKDAIIKSEIHRQRIIRNSFIGGFALVLVLALVVFNGYRNKQKANIIITQQKAEVELQKQIIEEKNTQITDSIVYAQEIQQSILPDKEKIKEALPDSFIFYQPKDILSGDFYFFYENEQSVYLAAADCTGHGVPGALMSMICSDKLKEAVQYTGNLSEVLSLVNKGIQKSLQQTGSKTANGDGMDIALVRLNKSNNKNELEYCGARSPLWIICNGSSVIEEVRANNTTVGGSTDANFNFESHSININSGDSFYLFTDGYADQFGGENRKKMSVKKFKEVLLGIQDKLMQEQGLSVSAFVQEWKGNQTQIDDILVIGVRV